MLDFKEKIEKLESIEEFEAIKNIANNPRIGMILDCNFGDLTYEIEDVDIIACCEIPNFPEPFVKKYENIIIGNLQGRRVICTQSNNSYSEKYSIEDITFYMKLLQYIGTKSLIVATTVKNISKNFNLDDLIIKSHINSSEETIEMVKAIAEMLNINVKQYTYEAPEVLISNDYAINVLEISCITNIESNLTSDLQKSKYEFITLVKEIVAVL